MRASLCKAATLAGAAAAALALSAAPAAAHEHRQVGPYELTVGWGDEPAYTGFKNSVQLIVSQGGKPVTDAGGTVKVEVGFGDEKTGPLALEPRFGTPGEYRAHLIPTRAGVYTFHFLGDIKGEKVDQTFTSSDTTFDSPVDQSEIQFPSKDPSTAALAARLERIGPRIDAAADKGTSASTLATFGLVVGAVGVLVGLGALVVGSRRPR